MQKDVQIITNQGICKQIILPKGCSTWIITPLKPTYFIKMPLIALSLITKYKSKHAHFKSVKYRATGSINVNHIIKNGFKWLLCVSYKCMYTIERLNNT